MARDRNGLRLPAWVRRQKDRETFDLLVRALLAYSSAVRRYEADGRQDCRRFLRDGLSALHDVEKARVTKVLTVRRRAARALRSLEKARDIAARAEFERQNVEKETQSRLVHFAMKYSAWVERKIAFGHWSSETEKDSYEGEFLAAAKAFRHLSRKKNP